MKQMTLLDLTTEYSSLQRLILVTVTALALSTPLKAHSQSCEPLKDYAIVTTAPQHLPSTLLPPAATATSSVSNPPTNPVANPEPTPQFPSNDPIGDFGTKLEAAALQELEQYAVMRFLSDMCGSNSTVKNYFASTCTKVNSWDTQYPSDPIKSVRSALQYDLQVIPGCLVKNRISSSIGYLAENAYVSMRTNDTTKVLYGMVTSPKLAEDCKAAGNGLAAACQIFATSRLVGTLMEISADTANADKYDLEKVYQYDLYQSLGADITLPDPCSRNPLCTQLQNLKGFIDPSEKSINTTQLKSDWKAVVSAQDGINSARANLAKNNTASNQIAWVNAVSAFSTALQQILSDANCAVGGKCVAGVLNDPSNFVDISAGLVKIYADVLNKDYATAVSDANPLLDCLSQADISTCSGITGQAQSSTNPDFQLLDVLASIADGSAPNLGNGLADISMQKRIPVWWVGGQFGFQGGHEQVVSTHGTASGAEYGMTLPIGLGFSNPSGCISKALDNKCFYGAGFNIVDIGALISTSSASGTQSGTHTGLSQILAPGVSTFMSIAGPVMVGLSYTYRSPNLRTTSATATTPSTTADSKNRVSAFLVIEVPFGAIPR